MHAREICQRIAEFVITNEGRAFYRASSTDEDAQGAMQDDAQDVQDEAQGDVQDVQDVQDAQGAEWAVNGHEVKEPKRKGKVMKFIAEIYSAIQMDTSGMGMMEREVDGFVIQPHMDTVARYFSVEAESEEEAKAKAREIAGDTKVVEVDGIPVSGGWLLHEVIEA